MQSWVLYIQVEQSIYKINRSIYKKETILYGLFLVNAQRMGWMENMLDGERFKHQLRVRYQETDQMGVVYHANYLNWLEITRTEWIRELGIPYSRLEEAGLLLPVTEVQLKYMHPARYDDMIEVHLQIIDSSYLRLDFEYEVYRTCDGLILISGTTRHVWVNRDWKPIRLDRKMPELYELIVSKRKR